MKTKIKYEGPQAAAEDMDAKPEDPIDLLAKKLVKMKLLTQTSAEIYALGLRRGTITSSGAAHELGIRESTAYNRLRRLMQNGFFVRSIRPGEELKTGKGHAIRFEAAPPQEALTIFEDSAELSTISDRVAEYLEVNAESLSDIGDLYLAESD